MTAGATYVPITTQTLGSAAPSVTFSSIPQGYTDLVLVINYGGNNTGANHKLNVGNGTVDTGINYSVTRLSGDGSSATSGRNTSFAYARLNTVIGNGDGTNVTNTAIVHLMNYSNTTTNKTILSRANQATGTYPGTEALVNLWRSTSAINILTVSVDAGNYLAGSTFTLYGISSA